MKMNWIMIAALALPLGTTAIAQSAMSGYSDIDDVDVIGPGGDRIGEIETVLVDDAGTPVAFVVELDDGFLDLGDTEVVMMMNSLSWENGRYTTAMTPEEVESLPVWDD